MSAAAQKKGLNKRIWEGGSEKEDGDCVGHSVAKLHKCKFIAKCAAVYVVLSHCSELWRKENTIQQTLSSLKEDLAKADQSLRSMAGKVSVQFLLLPFCY